MKIKRNMNSQEHEDSEAVGGKNSGSVFGRLNFGRAWNRAEERLDKSNRRGVRESPRKVS